MEEHAELHLALYLEHGKVADWVAFHMLSGKTEEKELMRIELCREARKNWKPTEEQRDNIRRAQLGKKHSKETRLKMSNSHKGKKFTKEHKDNLSKSRTGYKMSDEQKKKISQIQKGKELSEGTKKKISQALTDNPLRVKTYEITDPSGEIYVISNMKKFCEEKGLDTRNMSLVARGKRKRHKGYSCVEISK